MAMAEAAPTRMVVESTPAADPAPLGLGAFALTTFVLSGHNATFIPDLIWVGLALFYGGFWMSLGIFVVLAVTSHSFGAELKGANLPNAVAWFLLAFAIFNTYMLLWSTQVSVAVFLVFLTLEATEILLVIGNFDAAHGNANSGWIHLGGWVGIATAGCAWYTSAAGVINGMTGRMVLPVGSPLHLGRRSPMVRGQHA